REQRGGRRGRVADLLPQEDVRPRPRPGGDARRTPPRPDAVRPVPALADREGPAARGARGNGGPGQDQPDGRRPRLPGRPQATEPHVYAGQRRDRSRVRELRDPEPHQDLWKGGDIRWRPARAHYAQGAAPGDRPERDLRHAVIARVAQRPAGRARRYRSHLGRDRGDGLVRKPERQRRTVQPRGVATAQSWIVDEDLYLQRRDQQRPV